MYHVCKIFNVFLNYTLYTTYIIKDLTFFFLINNMTIVSFLDSERMNVLILQLCVFGVLVELYNILQLHNSGNEHYNTAEMN